MTETKPAHDANLAIRPIAKGDVVVEPRAFAYGADHPAMALWLADETGIVHRLQRWMLSLGAHAGRTLVLLPYAQLLPLANRAWAAVSPNAFAPRFETTTNWLESLGGPDPQSTDISHDMALDTLTAQQMLVSSGMGAQTGLAGLLAETAQQLAQWAAAASPDTRPEWVQRARQMLVTGMDSESLAWESQIFRVAVEWAAVSAYSTDVLFRDGVLASWDAVALVQGISDDPVAKALAAHWRERAQIFPLDDSPDAAQLPLMRAATRTRFHACADAEDEAQRAAACAIDHIAADRFPVALVSSDRALTRRVRAMLEEAGVAMRDENGWKLSTSRAGASLMALLRAANWNASTDAVLNAFKTAPAFESGMQALERALRNAQVRDWRHAAAAKAVQETAELAALCQRVDAVLAHLRGTHTLPVWLARLQTSLQDCGLWSVLQADEGAGVDMLAALRLVPADPQRWAHYADEALWAGARMDPSTFTGWVHQVLESHSFRPLHPPQEQVVILPMSQMLARPFAAVVLAGCDEVRLNPSPEPVGLWTPAQRLALGMPSRAEIESRLRAAWCQALKAPMRDVLWRTSDDAGSNLAASALVQWLQAQRPANSWGDEPVPHDPGALVPDPRIQNSPLARALPPPLPRGHRLPISHLSASGYEDLRTCPYRFFAMRQLGLQGPVELESEVDKRDFGLWLHAVLEKFHAALQREPKDGLAARSACLQAAADGVTSAMALPDGEFLPFSAAWPAVREGYLLWLARHELQGWAFASGETSHQQSLGSVMLKGRIDRTDSGAGSRLMVLDYKTEALQKTKARVKEPLEDTQVAFYAALLPNDILQAAYVHVSERETALVEQPRILEARDALMEGIQYDMAQIASGAPLPALGDGAACDFCQARGLCRKDFWGAP